MKALISPNEQPIQHIESWTNTNPPRPVIVNYPNSCRVAQVEVDTFPVAEPLFWTDCADYVKADQYYYDTVTQEINQIVNAIEPKLPAEDQPVAVGLQTL